VGQEVLGDHLVTVFAFLALGVGLEFFFGAVLELDVAVVARDGFVVDDELLVGFLDGLFTNDKGLRIDIPPIPSLILDKVTYHLIKSRPWQIPLNKLHYILDIFQRLIQMCRRRTLRRTIRRVVLRVDYELADLVDFGL
jgi:hypothetical protein